MKKAKHFNAGMNAGIIIMSIFTIAFFLFINYKKKEYHNLIEKRSELQYQRIEQLQNELLICKYTNQ